MHPKESISKYWLILITEVFLIIVATFMYHHVYLALLFAVVLLTLIGFTIKTIFEFKFLRIVSMICGGIAAISGFVWFIPNASPFEIHVSLVICCSFYAIFIAMAIFAIGKHVFVTDHVTSNKIVGSICLYLLMGICFAFIFAVMSIVTEGAFDLNDIPINMHTAGLRDFLYFSFSTLTTTGFGDLVANNPETRMVAYFESIIGTIYMAIVVARLIGMHITQKRSAE